LRPDIAFGPVLCMQRATYERVGGHADPTIRTMHTEDIGLARAVGDARIFSGRPDTSFRMYPQGWRQSSDGWVRTIATGASSTRWWLTLAVAWWVAALAGGWIAEPIVFPFCAFQVWVLGRRAGSMSAITALLYPAAVAVFAWFFLRSLAAIVLRRDVRWKRRSIAAR
jgi:4,4'-diaponeurosporenoate glycosyltransferase